VIITKDSETPNDIGVPSVVRADVDQLVCGYHLSIIRLKSQDNDPVFLARQLNSPRIASYFGRQANGTTRYGLGIDSVGETEIWLATPEEQRRLALILDTADAAIAKTGVLIDKLNKLKSGLLHDLLTRGIDDNGGLRPTHDVAPELFKNSSIGRIPKGWSFGPIQELATNHDGERIPVRQSDRSSKPGPFPYYGASGVIDYINDYIFDGNFVLLGEDGENLVSRELPLAFIASGQFWVNNHAHVLKPLLTTDIRYLVEILEFQNYKGVIIGSAQPKLSQAGLNKLRFRIPPYNEQAEIAKRLNGIDKRIARERLFIRKLTQVKAALSNELLTGKKPVLSKITSKV
jgi:type I restriction enzyme S subunit